MTQLNISALSLGALGAGEPKLLSKAASNGDLKAAEKVAKDFESVLLQKAMEEMQKTVPDSGLFESGTNEQVQGIVCMQLSEELGRQGGLGLWKQLSRQIQATTQAARNVGQESTHDSSL